jgi:hypothetical protein
MKNFISVLFLILSFNLFSTEVKVDSALCGELDPFIIGDACVVMVTAPASSKIALVFDYTLEDEMGTSVETIIGKTISINFDLVKKIKSKKMFNKLNELFGEDYYFMSAPLEAIQL